MRNTQEGRASLAPPAHFTGGARVQLVLALVGTVLVLASCSIGRSGSPVPPATVGPSDDVPLLTALPTAAPLKSAGATAGPPESLGPCQPAFGWLASAVQAGIPMQGATLSELVVGPASVTAGPLAVFEPAFQPAWWIVGKINGAGVRPEVVIWLTNRTSEGATGTIFAANAAALRYSSFGQGGSIAIKGEGQDALLACLTPIPQS
jgi:hypothetical protein